MVKEDPEAKRSFKSELKHQVTSVEGVFVSCVGAFVCMCELFMYM